VIALNNLAMLVVVEKRQLGEADQLSAKAIEVGGPMASLLDTRGVVLTANGRAPEAIAVLKRATAEDPSPVFYFHLAQACLAMGQQQAAADALAQARKLGLRPDLLHPLERQDCEKLLASFK
jgi:predicted Zn-dependent protease